MHGQFFKSVHRKGTTGSNTSNTENWGSGGSPSNKGLLLVENITDEFFGKTLASNGYWKREKVVFSLFYQGKGREVETIWYRVGLVNRYNISRGAFLAAGIEPLRGTRGNESSGSYPTHSVSLVVTNRSTAFG